MNAGCSTSVSAVNNLSLNFFPQTTRVLILHPPENARKVERHRGRGDCHFQTVSYRQVSFCIREHSNANAQDLCNLRSHDEHHSVVYENPLSLSQRSNASQPIHKTSSIDTRIIRSNPTKIRHAYKHYRLSVLFYHTNAVPVLTANLNRRKT